MYNFAMFTAFLVFTAFISGVFIGWYWRIKYLMPRRDKRGRFARRNI